MALTGISSWFVLPALFVMAFTHTMEQDRLIKTYITMVTEESSPKTYPPNGNDPVKVSVSYSLIAVTDVNRNGFVETLGYLTMEWVDPRLKFNRVSRRLRQENITNIRINPDNIWVPDVQLTNSANSRLEVLNYDPGAHAIVHDKGRVLYVPFVKARSLCDVLGQMQLGYINCTLKFQPWTHDSSQVDIQAGTADMGYFKVTGPWNVTDFSVQRNEVVYPGYSATYPDVTFNLTIRGRYYYDG